MQRFEGSPDYGNTPFSSKGLLQKHPLQNCTGPVSFPDEACLFRLPGRFFFFSGQVIQQEPGVFPLIAYLVQLFRCFS